MSPPLADPAHLSARSPGSRLAPDWLSLPDLLPRSEALLRSLFWEEFWELGLLSSSSQPPPACPGWCLVAARKDGSCDPQRLCSRWWGGSSASYLSLPPSEEALPPASTPPKPQAPAHRRSSLTREQKSLPQYLGHLGGLQGAGSQGWAGHG